jgi:hypothetical protein
MIGLQYSPACGLFSLTSPDMPGLLLAGKDPNKLIDDVPAVVKAMYRVGYNMNVEVVMEGQPKHAAPSMFSKLQSSTLVKVEPLAA